MCDRGHHCCQIGASMTVPQKAFRRRPGRCKRSERGGFNRAILPVSWGNEIHIFDGASPIRLAMDLHLVENAFMFPRSKWVRKSLMWLNLGEKDGELRFDQYLRACAIECRNRINGLCEKSNTCSAWMMLYKQNEDPHGRKWSVNPDEHGGGLQMIQLLWKKMPPDSQEKDNQTITAGYAMRLEVGAEGRKMPGQNLHLSA